MLFTEQSMHGAGSVLKLDHQIERPRLGRAYSQVFNEMFIARAFYCDVLHGRQVWEELPEGGAGLSFIVEGTRIDIGRNAADDGAPIVLAVLDPAAVAERCWDAGHTVRVAPDDQSTADREAVVSVIDPFGRQIDLVR
jgi:hypothetical protein